jgi:hypothetical protein
MAEPIIAVFNSSDDTVEMLRTALEADVRSSEPVQQCRFVLTTTNKPALDTLVGETEALEIIGKPYDLDRVTAAVRDALGDAR